MVKVEMEATRENMIHMLSPFFPRSYLNSLKQKELLKLGVKQKVWKRKSNVGIIKVKFATSKAKETSK